MRVEWQKTESGECERLEDVPKGAKVVGIDDKNVVAQCEACGKWIVEGEPCASGEDADLCGKCADECLRYGEQEEAKRVTHEMALDAGIPELEGTEY